MDALALALYYLEKRARTEKEIREKLGRKEIDPAVIDTVVEKLKSYGYIDDVRFASNFQRYRNDFKPMGKRRLKTELYIKGVPKEIIETVNSEPEKEFELALAAAETKIRQYSNLEPAVFQRRMFSFLARRGFDYGVIKKVLDELQNNV